MGGIPDWFDAFRLLVESKGLGSEEVIFSFFLRIRSIFRSEMSPFWMRFGDLRLFLKAGVMAVRIRRKVSNSPGLVG